MHRLGLVWCQSGSVKKKVCELELVGRPGKAEDTETIGQRGGERETKREREPPRVGVRRLRRRWGGGWEDRHQDGTYG